MKTLPTNGILKCNKFGLSTYLIYFRGIYLSERGSKEDAESLLKHYVSKLPATPVA